MNLERLKKLDELFQKEIDKEHLKGCSFAVFEKGEKIYENAFGTDQLDSVYKIYSMTKPITSVAAMILYEQGKIDLFDEVSMYLPAYKDQMVAEEKDGKVTLRKPARPILIRDLLNMTSGLPYPGVSTLGERRMQEIREDLFKRARSGEKFTNLDIVNEFAKAPLLFDPGERWLYGTSADVVAAIVEVVTGVPYGKWLKDNIFTPLEMNETGFYVDRAASDQLAKMYYFDDNTHILREANEAELIDLNEYAPLDPPYIESGGGGLYSTLEDYSHLALMLLSGGVYKNVRLLSEHTVDFMGKNQLTPAQVPTIYFSDLKGYGYGCLMRQLIDSAAAGSNSPEGEFGWDGLAGTYFFVDRKSQIAYVYMQQIAQGGDKTVRRRMKQIIYGAVD